MRLRGGRRHIHAALHIGASTLDNTDQTTVGINRGCRLPHDVGGSPADPLAVPEIAGLIVRDVEPALNECGDHRGVEERGGGDVVGTHRIGDIEDADVGAAERGQVTTDPKVCAKVAGEGANVGARGAFTSGEKLRGTCSMGMYNFMITFA